MADPKNNPWLPSLDDALREALTWGDASDEGYVHAYVLANALLAAREAK